MTDLINAIPAGFDTMVYCVSSGTVIEHEGEKLTVTDKSVVWLDAKFYCTDRIFAKIKEKTMGRLS